MDDCNTTIEIWTDNLYRRLFTFRYSPNVEELIIFDGMLMRCTRPLRGASHRQYAGESLSSRYNNGRSGWAPEIKLMLDVGTRCENIQCLCPFASPRHMLNHYSKYPAHFQSDPFIF